MRVRVVVGTKNDLVLMAMSCPVAKEHLAVLNRLALKSEFDFTDVARVGHNLALVPVVPIRPYSCVEKRDSSEANWSDVFA